MPILFSGSVSRRPGPAELVFPESLGAPGIGLVEIAQQLSARIEIDAVGVDLDRTLADLAFIWRGPAAAEIFPVIAVARSNTGYIGGLEAVLVQFGLNFRHQFWCHSDRRQHFIKAEASLGRCRCGECDESYQRQSGFLAYRHHDRNNLVYCVSCRMLARSARNVALPRSSRDASSARLAVATTTGSGGARNRWASVCPSGMSLEPAEIQFDASACSNACMADASGIACAALTSPTAT